MVKYQYFVKVNIVAFVTKLAKGVLYTHQIFKPGVPATGQSAPGFLELLLSVDVCMHVCVFACVCVHSQGYEKLVAWCGVI